MYNYLAEKSFFSSNFIILILFIIKGFMQNYLKQGLAAKLYKFSLSTWRKMLSNYNTPFIVCSNIINVHIRLQLYLSVNIQRYINFDF